MGDQDEGELNSVESTEEEQELERKVKKEIDKLKFYLEESDELLDAGDFNEIKLICKRTEEIQDRLNDLVSNLQELKLELENVTQRAVRQWKKDLKSTYAPLLDKRAMLCKTVEDTERQANQEAEEERSMLKYKKEERIRREIQLQEKEQWEEKIEAELRMTERKIEMERNAKTSRAKLPELKISPFNGSSGDWIRFENMFTSQIHNKPISDEEKYGYLLELVDKKLRDRLSNLKPGKLGYKTAWERLKTEYGHEKSVVAAHMDEIIRLHQVKGTNYEKVREFYESLSKNFDALQTLGQGDMLQGLVMSTMNKLPQVKPDLVRTDDGWEDWTMDKLLKAIQAWLKRNKMEDTSSKEKEDPPRRRERNWFAGKRGESPYTKERGPSCIFCEGKHWGDQCTSYDTIVKRRQFFVDKRLCFNCGRAGHQENKCRSRGCYKCKAKHHTSLCDKTEKDKTHENHNAMLSGYTSSPSIEEKSLPAIVPLKIQDQTFWAYLDTGSGRNFISKEAVKKLKLSPIRHETRNLVTVNGVKKKSMPVFDVTINAVDGQAREHVEITGSEMSDFTTIKRPTLQELKEKYKHVQGKTFYRTASEEYPIHVILGDATYCKIRSDQVYKGQPEDPIVEGTTFGWVVHGGKDYADTKCMYVRECSDYEKLYSLDVLGVEDRGEQDQADVHAEFQENITRKADGRYQVGVPWIPGALLSNTNEEPSRRRLYGVERKLKQSEKLKCEYEKIVNDQLQEGIVEKVPKNQTSDRVFYMPHKPVIRKDATTTKVRIVYDASAKPHPLANSVNECMHTGPPLQPLLWDVMVRARMSTNLMLADLQKAFLQVAIKEEDRDAFRFLFNVNGKEEHLRFTRVPFGVEASPFMLGATLQFHFDQQPAKFDDTVQALRENTYVDNLMKTASHVEELETFKGEATEILEDAKFTLHKWESNVEALDDEPNPSKILGHKWDKREDTIEIQAQATDEIKPVTKKSILSQLSAIYDPLGIISPTVVEGKSIYRKACDEKVGWNSEVSNETARDWIKWRGQLRNVRVPRSIAREIRKVKVVHLHVFADASNIACSAVTIAVIEHSTGVVKGLLTSKSRISKRNTSIARLELVSGQMAANMVKNLMAALRRWPIASATVWMDSMVALFWIHSPEKPWKVFVSNRTRKIAEITKETGVNWKYCPTDKNLADLGSRGATINKMVKGEWFNGPEWLLNEEDWPQQPKFEKTKGVIDEHKPISERVFKTVEKAPDEWEALLTRSKYWKTLRVTAWVLRFVSNALAKKNGTNKKRGPLTTEEIVIAKNSWVRKEQADVTPNLENPGWKIVKDEVTNVFRCKGRIPGYEPTYIEGGEFAKKLIRHVHEEIKHLGIANTMAMIRENWWIPKLRSKVKRVINTCNVCKVYSAKPYGLTATADLPKFRIEGGRPFETTGIDFAGPLKHKISKKEQGKCYVLIFTCATSRAVHLEMTRTQSAEEFQRKLNAFIARKTRPKVIVSDNASVFKTTATWIKKIRKSERLQDYLARQEVQWRFNLARSPWWGGIYERLLKDIKKTLYKVLGRANFAYEHLESIVIDIEKHVNNRPLTYVESEQEEEQVLTPNVVMWGQNVQTIEDVELDEEEVSKLHARLNQKRQHVWQRWKREYVHSLMESHRITRSPNVYPDVGEIVLVLGDEKNRGEWKRGKVVQHVKGKDGVVRGVKLLHKGHLIERPLPLVCSLEIKGTYVSEEMPVVEDIPEKRRSTRLAAKDARKKIQTMMRDEDE